MIIGFSYHDGKKIIYDNDKVKRVNNINSYLVDANNMFVRSLRTPLCDVPQMYIGIDYRNYILTKEEVNKIVNKSPEVKALIHPYVSGRDFIQRKPRYCLWFKDADLSIINKYKEVKGRVKK